MNLVVCVIAPIGRDAELVSGVLRQNGMNATISKDLTSFTSLSNDNIGPLVVAEETLTATFIQRLSELISQQPTWSDLPILILTSPVRGDIPSHHRQSERLSIGSPIYIERPVRTATLVSSVRAAIRARIRQYEIRDILHDRDHAHAELKHERETLQVVVDNLPVGVVLSKPSGEVVLASHNAERILRHPIGTHNQWRAFHPDGRSVAADQFPLPRAMSSGQAVAPEDFLYERGDGSLAWVSLAAAPIFNDDGSLAGGVVAISDIDHQKRADFNLRRSDERFRRLIEFSTIGLIISDFTGHVTYANPAILRMLGYRQEDTVAQSLRLDNISPPEYAVADRKAFEELRALGVSNSYQKEFWAKDGRRVPVLVGATIIPSQSEEDRENEVALFITNLSDQKQAESALIQSEKLAAVGRLAASISHEINNPLESVINLLYLARDNSTTPGDVRSLLDSADQELQRVAQISTQTLRFHRQSTKPRPITLEELLQPTLALYQGRLSNYHIELDLEHLDANPIICYESDIRQVLNNLIGNAIDAMRTGGRLRIRTGRAWLKGEALPGVRITIADTGHGIPPSVRARIFEPFYTTKEINGTGLGLWISRGIVDKHKGRIRMRSRTAEGPSGTVFTLFLPAQAV